ncbi:MAG: NADH-quinone oxidoreductase subunit J [Verrucomicrobiota bacterium]
MINPVFFIVLLFLLLLMGIATVMTLDLLKSAIGLAVTSAILSFLLFRMDAPLAGVFELSVCAGLIIVVFINVISLTKPLTDAAARARDRSRVRRFICLPILIVILGGILYILRPQMDLPLPPSSVVTDAREMLWNVRRMDLVGQILIILAGVFGVVILFKERPDIKGPRGEGNS